MQRKPEQDDVDPELFEVRIKTEQMTKGKEQSGIANYIKMKSKEKTSKREDVKREIKNRELKIIQEPRSFTAEETG